MVSIYWQILVYWLIIIFFKCKKIYEEYREYIKCLEFGGQVRPKIALSFASKTDPISLGLVVKPDLRVLDMTAKKSKSCWVLLGSNI